MIYSTMSGVLKSFFVKMSGLMGITDISFFTCTYCLVENRYFEVFSGMKEKKYRYQAGGIRKFFLTLNRYAQAHGLIKYCFST